MRTLFFILRFFFSYLIILLMKEFGGVHDTILVGLAVIIATQYTPTNRR